MTFVSRLPPAFLGCCAQRTALSLASGQMRLVTTLRSPRPPPYTIALDAPLTRRTLEQVATRLPRDLFNKPPNPSLSNIPTLPRCAAVLLALANVEDKPAIILEVRGKLRTHSGEIR